MRAIRFPHPSHATVVAYLALFVAMSGTAAAATGGAFILGKENRARAVSVLENSEGTPLALRARAGEAPLRVNTKMKVVRLNADRLDGKDASAFLDDLCPTAQTPDGSPCTRSIRVEAPMVAWQLPSGAIGGFSAQAVCPTGSAAVSGGYFLKGSRDLLDVVRGTYPIVDPGAGSARGWQVDLEPNPTHGQNVINAGSTGYALCLLPD